MKKAKVTYRGWPGHFICGERCVFHLNTLVELGEIRIVISTVGMMKNWHAPNAFNATEYEEIGCERYYETMSFAAIRRGEFYDADVHRQVQFEAPWSYGSIADEWKANKGHWNVVNEIVDKMETGQPIFDMEGSAITSTNKRVTARKPRPKSPKATS